MFLFAVQMFALFSTLNKFEAAKGFDIHRHSARIIQGNIADIKEFPYYAGLLNCGATILSESWVVTAAHCVYPEPTVLNYIWVGGESFGTSKIVTFDKVVVHSEVSLIDPFISAPVNDIALLRLSESLKFTDRIQPVDLPSFKDLTRSNTDSKLMLAGRGLDEKGDLLRYLQKMEVLRLSTEECLKYMPFYIQEGIKPIVPSLEKAIICGKRADGASGLCEGDSGSPLMQGNTLVGIASFIGAPCDVATLGFYVNVVNYVPWIKSVTGLK